MSGTTGIFRTNGQTVALSVVATAHAAVPLVLSTSVEVTNFVALINPGAVAVAVKLSVAGTAPILPVDGTPGDFILAPGMSHPVVLVLPSEAQGSPCQITAIGAAAGPTLIYATPVVMQH